MIDAGMGVFDTSLTVRSQSANLPKAKNGDFAMNDVNYYRPSAQVGEWLHANRESLKKQVVDPALAGRSIELVLVEDVSVIKQIWHEICAYAEKAGANHEVKNEMLTALRDADEVHVKKLDDKKRQEMLRSVKEHEDMTRAKGVGAPPPVISPDWSWHACIFCAGAAIEATGHPVIAGIGCVVCGYFGG